jgi:hypothetical protein
MRWTKESKEASDSDDQSEARGHREGYFPRWTVPQNAGVWVVFSRGQRGRFAFFFPPTWQPTQPEHVVVMG